MTFEELEVGMRLKVIATERDLGGYGIHGVKRGDTVIVDYLDKSEMTIRARCEAANSISFYYNPDFLERIVIEKRVYTKNSILI